MGGDSGQGKRKGIRFGGPGTVIKKKNVGGRGFGGGRYAICDIGNEEGGSLENGGWVWRDQ